MIFYHNDFFEIIPDVIQRFALLQRLFLRVQAKGRLNIISIAAFIAYKVYFCAFSPALFANFDNSHIDMISSEQQFIIQCILKFSLAFLKPRSVK